MTTSNMEFMSFGDHFYTWKQVIAFTKASESTIRRSIQDGLFPPPIKLFKGRVAFKKADLFLWMEGKWRQAA